jgi:hypothetical protein
VNLLLRFKSICVYTLLTAFLVSSVACGYRPAYLQEGKKTEISERWKVQKINPSRLSADEKSTLEQFGTPENIRFYRRLSQQRERVYAWIYADPVRFVTFIDGKKVDYAVLDEDLTSLNEQQRNTLFWGGIAAGSVAALGVLYYYFFARK